MNTQKRFIIATLFAFLFLVQAGAQSNSMNALQTRDFIKKYGTLKVGDLVPDYTFQHLINYQGKSAQFSDFKGKLMILDFWSTHCGACIAAWPKMIELQKSFEGKLQILLVNSTENEQVVRTFIEKRKKLSHIEMNLPVVCGDTVLGWHLFDHYGEPHYVWIDPSGKVSAITAGDVVNAQRIEEALKNNDFNLPQKQVQNVAVDFRKPLFVSGNGGNGEHLLWHSVFCRYFPGLQGTTIISANEKNGYEVTITNADIPLMYAFLYGSQDNAGVPIALPTAYMELRVKDSSRFVRQIGGEVQYDHIYSYQLVAPPVSKQQLIDFAKGDLNRYAGLQAHWEKMKKTCLVLTADDTSMIRYRSGAPMLILNDVEAKLNKVTLDEFLSWLQRATNYYYCPYPLINETGFKGLVGDIMLETDVQNPTALDKALQKYKMHFTLQQREVNVLVLAEGKEQVPSVNLH